MPEIPFGSMPGYLMTQGPDKEYLKQVKKDRKQLSSIRKDIKENYILSSKCKISGVTKSQIDQRIEKGKLRTKPFNGKVYYHQGDFMKLF